MADKKFETSVTDADIPKKQTAPVEPASTESAPDEAKVEAEAPPAGSKRLGAEQAAGRAALERKHSNTAVEAEKSRGKKK